MTAGSNGLKIQGGKIQLMVRRNFITGKAVSQLNQLPGKKGSGLLKASKQTWAAICQEISNFGLLHRVERVGQDGFQATWDLADHLETSV